MCAFVHILSIKIWERYLVNAVTLTITAGMKY